MPAIIVKERSSSMSENSPCEKYDSPFQVMDDGEYPAVNFPGYSEKPLSEQLEPIAVVGMGTL